jgi:hypothetical protein
MYLNSSFGAYLYKIGDTTVNRTGGIELCDNPCMTDVKEGIRDIPNGISDIHLIIVAIILRKHLFFIFITKD